MLRKILFALLLLTSTVSLAQTGSITGVVTDAKTGETVLGANAVIQGTTVGAATDLDGKFSINNLKPGTYNLAVSFVTYKTHIIADVVVEAAKITSVQIQLQEDATELQEVVISGIREINNDYALLSAIKDSKLVVSGISAEQIVKLPDNDAAQIMKRVTGLTIVENRFVMVRGLPERYNQVMINNAIAPSTEIDKRSFSFDLIPSGALDQLLIYKSASAELPGDFAGGIVKVFTKQAPSENFFNFGLNFGYRAGTTFGDFRETNRSSTDFLGFDKSFRSLPNNFPTTEEMVNSLTVSPLREQAGRQLSGRDNAFDYNQGTAPMDYGFSFGLGRKFDIGSVGISTLATANYSNSFLNYSSTLLRYSQFDKDAKTESIEQFNFRDTNFERETKISLANNWLFKFSPRNQIEFKNLYVQIGESKSIFRTGTDFGTQGGIQNNNGSLQYVSRGIYTGQLQGKIASANEKISVDWVLGLNRISRNEPNFRRYRSFFNESEDAFSVQLPSGTSLIDASRFFSELVDLGYTNGIDVQKRFGAKEDKRAATVKAGYLVHYKKREFNARVFSYSFAGNDGALGESLRFLPVSQLFTTENLYTLNPNGTVNTEGLALSEGTNSNGQDSYEGKSLTAAGYVTGSVPIGKFDLSGGFRLEYFDQDLILYNGDSTVNINTISPLPFVNIAFNISERSLIRAAYSRTVNRPEFRELAPFVFYQFEYNSVLIGKSTLKPSTIDNIDVRWEMYPNPGETISIGGFYKSIDNPIEFAQLNLSGNIGFQYQNAPKALSYGFELEVKKSLASLAVSKLLRNTTVNLNATLITSEVDLSNQVGTFQENRRPLQGQSPYVINSGIYYSDPNTGWSVNAAYNVFGNRIFALGSTLYPTWLERPRNAIDMQIAKQVKQMEVKLNIQNLLNAPYRFIQDNDENQKADGVDDPLKEYRTGSVFTVSFGWKFLAK